MSVTSSAQSVGQDGRITLNLLHLDYCLPHREFENAPLVIQTAAYCFGAVLMDEKKYVENMHVFGVSTATSADKLLLPEDTNTAELQRDGVPRSLVNSKQGAGSAVVT